MVPGRSGRRASGCLGSDQQGTASVSPAKRHGCVPGAQPGWTLPVGLSLLLLSVWLTSLSPCGRPGQAPSLTRCFHLPPEPAKRGARQTPFLPLQKSSSRRLPRGALRAAPCAFPAASLRSERGPGSLSCTLSLSPTGASAWGAVLGKLLGPAQSPRPVLTEHGRVPGRLLCNPLCPPVSSSTRMWTGLRVTTSPFPA